MKNITNVFAVTVLFILGSSTFGLAQSDSQPTDLQTRTPLSEVSENVSPSVATILAAGVKTAEEYLAAAIQIQDNFVLCTNAVLATAKPDDVGPANIGCSVDVESGMMVQYEAMSNLFDKISGQIVIKAAQYRHLSQAQTGNIRAEESTVRLAQANKIELRRILTNFVGTLTSDMGNLTLDERRTLFEIRNKYQRNELISQTATWKRDTFAEVQQQLLADAAQLDQLSFAFDQGAADYGLVAERSAAYLEKVAVLSNLQGLQARSAIRVDFERLTDVFGVMAGFNATATRPLPNFENSDNEIATTLFENTGQSDVEWLRETLGGGGNE